MRTAVSALSKDNIKTILHTLLFRELNQFSAMSFTPILFVLLQTTEQPYFRILNVNASNSSFSRKILTVRSTKRIT